jgi:hypothetical protein
MHADYLPFFVLLIFALVPCLLRMNTFFKKPDLNTFVLKFEKNCRTNVRKYSFSQRVVDEWNKIPKKVIDSQTINTFKSLLNNHWKNLDIKFSPDIYQPGDEKNLLRRVQGAE